MTDQRASNDKPPKVTDWSCKHGSRFLWFPGGRIVGASWMCVVLAPRCRCLPPGATRKEVAGV